MLLRSIAAALVLAGLGLGGLAAYSYFAVPVDPGLVVLEADLDLGDCTVGQETDAVFRLQNNSGRTLRVLSLVPC
jgi:hypothetical protein